MKIGAQLYTVRNYTQNEKDFACTIEKIANMGYETVQISGIGEEITPEKARKICDDNGVKIVLTHSDPDRIMNDTERLIEEHDIMGCDYIGIGGMPEKYRNPEWLYHFAMDYKEAAQKIKEAGKLFMYHHHAFEFYRLSAEGAKEANPDKKMIDYLMEWFTPEEMGFILDTYWVQAAGADPAEWIQKLGNRISCVHFKDMAARKDNGYMMAPVMEGNLNWQRILKALENTNCKYALVEQDVCQTSPFDCLKMSFDNLHKAGLC